MEKDFISATPDTGGQGKTEVQVSAGANPTFQERETTANFSVNGQVLKSVKAVQAEIPFVVQLGIDVLSNNRYLTYILYSLTRGDATTPPTINGRIAGSGINKYPEDFAFRPMAGALTSFFDETSEDLIVDFQWMNGSGVVLSSWYTTLVFDNEDGKDWKNYTAGITVDNTMPDSNAVKLMIRIGKGRGDTGIEEDQIWMRYHFILR